MKENEILFVAKCDWPGLSSASWLNLPENLYKECDEEAVYLHQPGHCFYQLSLKTLARTAANSSLISPQGMEIIDEHWLAIHEEFVDQFIWYDATLTTLLANKETDGWGISYQSLQDGTLSNPLLKTFFETVLDEDDTPESIREKMIRVNLGHRESLASAFENIISTLICERSRSSIPVSVWRMLPELWSIPVNEDEIKRLCEIGKGKKHYVATQ